MDEKEFSVFINDLYSAAKQFYESSVNCQRQVPNGGRFLRASGGEAQLDRIIDVTLGTIEEMHVTLVQALEQHSMKLRHTAEAYDGAETKSVLTINAVMQQMIKDDPPPFNNQPSF